MSSQSSSSSSNRTRSTQTVSTQTVNNFDSNSKNAQKRAKRRRNISRNKTTSIFTHMTIDDKAQTAIELGVIYASLRDISETLDRLHTRITDQSKLENTESQKQSQSRRPYVCWFHKKYGTKAKKCKSPHKCMFIHLPSLRHKRAPKPASSNKG